MAPSWRKAASPLRRGAGRRPARCAVLAACLTLIAALAAPVSATAGCGKAKRLAATADARLGDPAPLAIGDSVLLGAAAETAALGYDVNVRGCRQMAEGLGVLRRRQRAGTLPRVVTIALGSNWTVTHDQVRAALRILGPRRTLGLVTPREVRGTSYADAATLRAAAARWPRRIVLVDWVEHTRRHRGLTYSDGIHLTPAGRTAFANLLKTPLARATPGAPSPAGGGTAGGGAKAP